MKEYDVYDNGRWIGTVMASSIESACHAAVSQFIIRGKLKVSPRDTTWEE